MNAGAFDVAAAYRRCEAITRQQAKNFAYGIALLPGAKRRALSAVYAYARRIDDIGDGTLPVPDKIAALSAARGSVVVALTTGTQRMRPLRATPFWWRCAMRPTGSRSRSRRSAS